MTDTDVVFNEAKATKVKLEAQVNILSQALQRFPKKSHGLTPNTVKVTVEFKEAKQAYGEAFIRLQHFNKWYIETFAEELKAERGRRYE